MRSQRKRGAQSVPVSQWAVSVEQASEISGVPVDQIRILVAMGFVMLDEIDGEEFITRSELAQLALLPK